MDVELGPNAVGEFIGGVDEDEVEPRRVRLRRGASQRPTSARTSSTRSPRPRLRTLPSAGASVAVDQGRVGGAARDRLDRQRPGAAVEVEDAGALDVAERREDRLAHAVGGRPHLPAPRRDEPAPPQLSGDHPHRAGSARRAVAEAAPGRVHQRAELRRVERAVAAQQLQHLLAGREQGRRVLGQRGDAKRGRPCWRVPSISPSPRSARSTSASLKPSRSRSTASSRRRASSPASSAKRMQWTRARRARPGRAAGAAGRRRSARRPRSASRSRWGRRCRPRSRWSRRARRSPPSENAAIASALSRRGHLAVQDADREVAQLLAARAARPRPRPPAPAASRTRRPAGRRRRPGGPRAAARG